MNFSTTWMATLGGFRYVNSSHYLTSPQLVGPDPPLHQPMTPPEARVILHDDAPNLCKITKFLAHLRSTNLVKIRRFLWAVKF